MTVDFPTDQHERDALAGEYVLGTLDARMAAAIAGALGFDHGLRRAVEAWEDRLTPLASLAMQEAPPPELWDRIEAGLPKLAAPTLRKTAWAWDVWRVWAVGASLAAVALAGFAMVQATRPTVMEATILPAQIAPAALAPAPPSALATAPAPTQAPIQAATAPPQALATVPDPAPTPIAPAPPKFATQPISDTGIRKATGENNGAVRPAAGGSGGLVRPPGIVEPGGILR
ncbi:MAG: hypothetical protein H7251_11460 [Acetobacteraceae bacterium]|nr:hypothetical protein [Acetobacteraceae bacterium]